MKSPARSPAAPGVASRGRPYDRHSATGSRGLPKKGGAGGKGVWGAMLDEGAEGAYMDKNDPNYDSAEEEEGGPPEMDLAAKGIPAAPAAAATGSEKQTPPASAWWVCGGPGAGVSEESDRISVREEDNSYSH